MDVGRGGIGVGNDDKGVDLEVAAAVRLDYVSGFLNSRELAVDVDGVEAGDKVNQDIVDALGDLLQKSSGNFLV